VLKDIHEWSAMMMLIMWSLTNQRAKTGLHSSIAVGCSGLESMVPVPLAQLRHYLEQMPSFEIKLEIYKYISAF
jgi:hypothetical protein